MPARRKGTPTTETDGRGLSDRRLDFSHQILACLASSKPRHEFLSEMLGLVLEHSGCDAVEMWLSEGSEGVRCEASGSDGKGCGFSLIAGGGELASAGIGRLCADTLSSCSSRGAVHVTGHGSIWIPCSDPEMPQALQESCTGRGYRWLALVPLNFGEEMIGMLLFKNTREDAYDPKRLEYLETLAAKFEMGLLHQLSRARLSERVKELTCLYGIAQTASDPARSLEDKITEIVGLLPAAWQYPSRASARIVIDGREFCTPGFSPGGARQAAQVVIGGRHRGAVEVHYALPLPLPRESLFLEEEQKLIDNIAGQVAQMLEQNEAMALQAELREQLARADRLAAIGQLAAGVAHELNEPLNTILGFAQLVAKTPDMPGQALEDIGRIIDASLHARSIIRELLIFARQDTPSRGRVNLNRIIEDELGLFESLCLKSSVELRRVLAPDLPEIEANRSQMLQVISNLVINALQAMPEGGAVTIETSFDASGVSLIIQDTGVGMSEEVKNNIFLPFFTTKDVDQGTGLGLAVVHGIVASHGGRIAVESSPGEGSRFMLTFPRCPELETEDGER
ncbi:MAG: ATP-binding protein [Desulfomonilia bacterium]|jgi:two-component system NtrC family sensor kinase